MAHGRDSMARACKSFEQDLVLYHYGELTGADEERAKSHIGSCAGCSDYLKELAALLPLTVKTDDPPQEFWQNYNRELRHKLDLAAAPSAWWHKLATVLQPRSLAAFVAATVVVLALTFTIGRDFWSPHSATQDDEVTAALAENLEFFSAMEVLDNLELLEFMGIEDDDAA